MKEIYLTQNQIAIVDDWRYEEVNQFKWSARWDENTKSFYAIRTEYHPRQVTVYMHREIANTPKGLRCDHINHNTLDNQECNLRNVTSSQNTMNSKTRYDNELGERCIHFYGSGYQVRIMKNGKRVFDKTYQSLDEAIAERDKAIKRIHGEFYYEE